MELIASLLEFGYALAPTVLGVTLALGILAINPPVEQRARRVRLALAFALGALPPTAGYTWMFHGAGPGWWFYIIGPALMYVIVAAVTIVSYLKMQPAKPV